MEEDTKLPLSRFNSKRQHDQKNVYREILNTFLIFEVAYKLSGERDIFC